MPTALKESRGFLEPTSRSNSYYVVEVNDYNGVSLTLADCTRSISWYFGKPGDRAAKAKIAKVKKVVDSIYDYLHQPKE